MRTCKVVILDEVNCTLVNLHSDHLSYFYEEYGVHAPGYFFNPKFKLGSWDGKIRFFHKTGKTYVALLDDIIPRLQGLQYEIELDDRRESALVLPSEVDQNFFHNMGVTHQSTGEPWIMRDYQVSMVNTLLNYGSGIGLAATGAGKSSMTAAIAKSYELAGNLRSVIIVPDKSLTIQTKQAYQMFKLDVGEYSGTLKDIEHQHVISTWQAMKNNKDLIKTFDVVVVDECHGIQGKVLTDLLNNYGKQIPYRFGVTGTLPKDKADSLAVRVAVGNVRYSIPAHELIDQNVLSDVDIEVIEHDIDLTSQYEDYLTTVDFGSSKVKYSEFKRTFFPDWASETAYAQKHKDRLKWISEFLTETSSQEKGNTLCLVSNIKTGKKLASMIEGSIFLHGKDDAKERKEYYDKFSTHNNMMVIATAQIASTGLDIPRIFNLVFVDIGKSFKRTIQAIGRGLRTAHDKDHVKVFDLCTDFKYSKQHQRDRIKYYKEAKYPYSKKIIKL